ncbi:hypothetical protein RUMGNA_02113 [Mediterraneibacter gnavus ATCC 29149]|uniref:Uncharacterized protein n=1 Tax=Mediterraneibacter gnavus (strain ATCC 29149 / DSM 114966 / JCM 6515 / VPI C7-9) TaxID=411470 RepID=A7B3I3_MEDG7|nr:hypothetical protein RUMGNA_02113 [Mediterraneibacter gnavus ATCC 29149]
MILFTFYRIFIEFQPFSSFSLLIRLPPFFFCTYIADFILLYYLNFESLNR